MRQSVFLLTFASIVLAVLPTTSLGDSLMHVGIGRGMRTGTTKDIDIGRSPHHGYGHGGWGWWGRGRYMGESLMHVGIGRGMRSGTTKEIDIGRGPYRGWGYWLTHYIVPEYYSRPPMVNVRVNNILWMEPSEESDEKVKLPSSKVKLPSSSVRATSRVMSSTSYCSNCGQ
jgi:hypothetical protein